MKLIQGCAKWLLPFGFLIICFAWFPWAWLPFHHAKWLALYSFAILVCISIFSQGLLLPRLPKIFSLAFLLVALASIAHLLWFNAVNWQFSLLDRVSVFVVALLAWRQFHKAEITWLDFRRPLLLALFCVAALGIWQMQQVGFPGIMPFTKVGSSFGYANITAQFVAIALLLLFSLGLPELKTERMLFALTIAVALAYLFLLRGRSVLLGFLVSTLFLFVLRWRHGQKFLNWRFIGAALVVSFSVLISVQMLKGKSFSEAISLKIFAEKSDIVAYRQDVWTQTLRMIADKPMGIGLDRFEFEFVPYHRFGTTLSYASLTLSPHNEFLRYLAEEGVVLSVSYLLLLSYLLFAWFRKSSLSSRRLFLPIFCFYFFELLFQFPLQTGFPSFFAAILLGAIVAETWSGEVRISERWSSVVLSLVLLFLFIGTAQSFLVRAFEKSAYRDSLSVACSLMPSNWRACMKFAQVEMRAGKLLEARQIVDKELERAPWNYYAWRNMGVIGLRGGDQLEGCFYHWRYQDLFPRNREQLQPTVGDVIDKVCKPKWLEYFERKRPMKYYPNKGARPQFNTIPSE
jgi:O-antigen ligase